MGDDCIVEEKNATGRGEAALQRGPNYDVQSVSSTDRPARAGEEKVGGTDIMVDEEGGMRWSYQYSFWKNPSVLITTWKVLMFALSFPALLAFVLGLENGIVEAGKTSLMILGTGALVLTGLLAMAYVLIGWSYEGRYYVLFKMDKKGVHHIQLKSRYDKAAAMGLLTALIGLAGNNYAVAGAGLTSAMRQGLYTDFSRVRSIKVREKRNIIYVNEALSRNQIYAEDGDFSFVRDHIIEHCPKGINIR